MCHGVQVDVNSGSDSGRSTPSYVPVKDFVLPAIEELEALEALASHRVIGSDSSSTGVSPYGTPRLTSPGGAVRAVDLQPVPEVRHTVNMRSQQCMSLHMQDDTPARAVRSYIPARLCFLPTNCFLVFLFLHI